MTGLPRISDGFNAINYDSVMDTIEAIVAAVGGRCVLSGGALVNDSGDLQIELGVAFNGLRRVEWATFTAAAPPLSETNYVWLAPSTLLVTYQDTDADPGGENVCLGRVTCDGSGVTAVDDTGRCVGFRWSGGRTLLLGTAGLEITPINAVVIDGGLEALTIEGGTVSAAIHLTSVSGGSPAPVAANYQVFSKVVSGYQELMVIDGAGVETQLTHKGRFITGGVLYRHTAIAGGDTVNNTAAETVFASKVTIPEDTLQVGDILLIKAFGTYGTDGVSAGTAKLLVKFGATTLIATGDVVLTTGLSGVQWSLEAIAIVRTLGATGTIEVQGHANLGVTFEAFRNTAEITIDTTADADLGVAVDMSVADGDNTFTMRSLVIQKL